MTSSPLQAAATAPAVNAQQSIGNKPTLGQRITSAIRKEDLSYQLDYSDPTGEQAIRAAAGRIRAALKWRPRTVNKLVMGPEKLPIHISDDLCEEIFVFLAIKASVKPTNSGKGFTADVKKNTPAAVEFGDRNSSRGSTETPKKE